MITRLCCVLSCPCRHIVSPAMNSINIPASTPLFPFRQGSSFMALTQHLFSIVGTQFGALPVCRLFSVVIVFASESPPNFY